MLIKKLLCMLVVLWIAGCAHKAERYDYAQFRTANPKSILIVPVVNRSLDVDAPNYFLSSISVPIAERGYYVFPVNLVKQVMNDDGLSDADMVHGGDPIRLASVFGADSVMYISIGRWDAQYAVLSTTVTVELDYSLKSGRTGEEIWKNTQRIVYKPQNNNSVGSPLATLIAAAITAAVEKAAPNYMPLAHQANVQAIYSAGRGLPAGPYDPNFMKDLAAF